MNPSRCVVVSLSLLLALALSAAAAIELPAVFGDGMVLQRGAAVPIWGTAEPGAEITVSFARQQQTAVADAQGRWSVRLRPLRASRLPRDLVVSSQRQPNQRSRVRRDAARRTPTANAEEPGSSRTFTNVLVGEVWLCSGQSNMEWPVSAATNGPAEVAAAQWPQIRLFQVPHVASLQVRTDCPGGSWVECAPPTVRGFSAVGYFFGRELHRILRIPVGLIDSSWGGTPCEAWTSGDTLRTLPDFAGVVDRLAAAGTNAPPQGAHTPGALFNGMIAPLVPYAIRGAIWYQGESNAGRARQYRELFPAMIRDWRTHWGQGPFPFGFVQLANFMATKPQPGDSAWAELREAQNLTLALRNTGQAVIIDLGEATDIHPRNKQDVGKRLALWAQAKVYRRRVEYSGPRYRSYRIDGNRVRLRFSHVGRGLVAQGGGPLQQFSIAGTDRKFVWANAKIEAESVVVWSDQVPRPVAVRYAWADNPDGCNLYGRAGLPASPFRTDDWPGVTGPKR
ncbi:sialate O-acetylesterase [bacterium]|nr:sialate O-acetylesterase [bacterium]